MYLKVEISQILVATRRATKIRASSNVCRYSICDSLKGRVQMLEIPSYDGVSFLGGKMETGHFYFLNDNCFKDFTDTYLMQNKEAINGTVHDRSCFLCFSRF